MTLYSRIKLYIMMALAGFLVACSAEVPSPVPIPDPTREPPPDEIGCTSIEDAAACDAGSKKRPENRLIPPTEETMPPPVQPYLAHTAYRNIIDADGVQAPGRFAMQFMTGFAITDEPETSSLPARTVIKFNGELQPPPDVDFLVKNSNGDVMLKIDQDGIQFYSASGGSPRPHVSAGRAVRDVELEAALAAVGLIVVDP